MKKSVIGLLVLILVGCASQQYAATPGRLQHTSTYCSDVTSCAVAFGSNVAAQSLIVAWGILEAQDVFSTATPTFSDTLGNTWTVVINQGVDDIGGDTARTYGAWALSPTGGADTVTVTPPGSAFTTIQITEYNNIVQTSPFDKSASQGDPSGTTSDPSGTTSVITQAVELVSAAVNISVSSAVTITETAPCTLVEEQQDGTTALPFNVCDYVTSSIGTQSTTWTVSPANTYASGIMTFKALTTRRRGGGPLWLLP